MIPWRKTASVLLIATIIAASAGCVGQKQTIKIGVHVPLTGSAAQMGIDQKTGMEFAVEQINNSGGVLGRKLELLVNDDEGKPDKTSLLVDKLLSQGVVAIIGGPISTTNLAAAPVTERAKMPYFALGTATTLTSSGFKYLIRASVPDQYLAVTTGKYVVATRGAKKVAIIFENDTWGTGYAEQVVTGVKEAGGTVVAKEECVRGDRDFTSQVLRIQAQKPDALVIVAFATGAAAISKQVRTMFNYKVMLQGVDVWGQPETVRLAGLDASEGLIYNDAVGVRLNPDPYVQQYVDGFSKKYGGKDPTVQATKGYVAVQLLADAIKRANSLKTDKIRDALYATRSFRTPLGEFTTDANGDGLSQMIMVEIQKDGSRKLVWKNFK